MQVFSSVIAAAGAYLSEFGRDILVLSGVVVLWAIASLWLKRYMRGP